MYLLLAILAVLGAQDLPGAGVRPKKAKPVVIVERVTPDKSEVRSGEVVKLAFELEIPRTWHIYPAGKKPVFGTPTVFTFENAEIAGAIEESPLKKVKEEGIGDIEYHEGSIKITVPVRLKGSAGPLSVRGKISYQICDPKICVDNTSSFSVPLVLREGAPDASEQNPVLKIRSVAPGKTEVKPGEVFELKVEVEIPRGWHIYPTTPTDAGVATTFKFDSLEIAGSIVEPKPAVHPAEGGAPAYGYHEGTIAFGIPLRLKSDAKAGPAEPKGRMGYQLCDPKVCLPPTEQPIEFALAVLPGTPAQSPSENAAALAATKEFEKEGLLGFLFTAMAGGLVSLVMPCVYPLIPITVTYFIKQGAGSRARSLLMAGAYSIGIILVFTLVGFLFSLFLGAAGARKFASDPWVNIAVALLFFWFAFSLFGLYEITLPSGFTGALTGKQRSGVGGAFILGGLFSVVTFTCTIPVAASILAFTASTGGGHRFIGFLAMLVYSTTMAIPFFILGLFPGMLTGVKKSGGDWLHTVKVTAGFAELALALFYLAKADQVLGWGVLTRPVMLSVWTAVLAITSFYLLRVFQLRGDEVDPEPSTDGPPARRQVGVLRMLIALFFLLNAVFVASGFSGRTLGVWDIVLPVNTETPKSAAPGNTIREPSYDNLAEAEAQAKKIGKPLFVEFTGVT